MVCMANNKREERENIGLKIQRSVDQQLESRAVLNARNAINFRWIYVYQMVNAKEVSQKIHTHKLHRTEIQREKGERLRDWGKNFVYIRCIKSHTIDANKPKKKDSTCIYPEIVNTAEPKNPHETRKLPISSVSLVLSYQNFVFFFFIHRYIQISPDRNVSGMQSTR